MTESDKKAFAEVMQGLAEDKGLQLSAAGIALKYEALKGFTIEQIKTASLGMMREKRFATMPSVADFAEFLGGGRAEDQAELEAAKVWQSIGRIGGWTNVVFDNAITQAVIQYTFGGWSTLCGEMMEDQRKWFIKDFVKAYSAYSRGNVRHYGVLPGRGVGEPVLIGDKEKALEIMNTTQGPLTISSIPLVRRLMQFGAADDLTDDEAYN